MMMMMMIMIIIIIIIIIITVIQKIIFKITSLNVKVSYPSGQKT